MVASSMPWEKPQLTMDSSSGPSGLSPIPTKKTAFACFRKNLIICWAPALAPPAPAQLPVKVTTASVTWGKLSPAPDSRSSHQLPRTSPPPHQSNDPRAPQKSPSLCLLKL